MDNAWLEYAPIIIVVLTFCFKNQIFVTPAQLKDAKAEMLQEVEIKFATKEVVEGIKEDIRRLEDKIDKLQEIILQKI